MLALLPILLLGAQADAPAAAGAPQGRPQIFIAPSGEPFRDYGDVPYPVARWFAEADKNGDGKLDQSEFQADFMRFFEQLDVNHDGAIDSTEKTRYETTVVPETMGSSWSLAARREEEAEKVDLWSSDDQGATTLQKAKPRYGLNPIGAARFDLLGLPEPVAAMDTELRGRISRSAAEEAARERFATLDELHRGYLTLDDLPPTYAEHGGGGGHRKRHKR
jgi:Ca2+-binding EF-hand superfamily protein